MLETKFYEENKPIMWSTWISHCTNTVQDETVNVSVNRSNPASE